MAVKDSNDLKRKVDRVLDSDINDFSEVDEVTLNEVYRVESGDDVYYVKRFVSQDWFDRIVNRFDSRDKVSFPSREKRTQNLINSREYLRVSGFELPDIEFLDKYTVLKESVPGEKFRDIEQILDGEKAQQLGSKVGEVFWNLNSEDMALIDTTADNLSFQYEDDWNVYVIDSEFFETEASRRDQYEDIFGITSHVFRWNGELYQEFMYGFGESYEGLPKRHEDIGFASAIMNSLLNRDYEAFRKSYENWS